MNTGVNTSVNFDTTSGTTNTSSSIDSTGASTGSSSSAITQTTRTSAETETMDLGFATEQAEQESKSFGEQVGDFFSGLWSDIKDTGAKIVEGGKAVVNWAIDGIVDLGSKISEACVNLASNVTNIIGGALKWAHDTYISLQCTMTVITTSVVSGLADIVEGLVDGLAWCGGWLVEGCTWLVGSVVGWFNDDAGQSVKDWGHQANQDVKQFIATDWVGVANDWFYQDTAVGRYINENSYLEYDSKLAQGIRSITETVGEVVIATVLTIFTGGAATFAFGALNAIGDSAESTYQQNGTETSLWQELMIGGSGVLGGLSAMGTGKLGAGFVNIAKDIVSLGAKEVLGAMLKKFADPKFLASELKRALWSKDAIGNYVGTAMMTSEDFIPYLNGEKEFSLSAIFDIGGHFIHNLAFNVAEDIASEFVMNYKGMPRYIESVVDATGATPVPALVTGTTIVATAEEIADGATDAGAKLDIDTPSVSPTTTSRVLDDDEAIDAARRLVDSGGSFNDYRDLDDTSIQKMMQVMTDDEISRALKDMPTEDAARMYNLLPEATRIKFTDKTFGDAPVMAEFLRTHPEASGLTFDEIKLKYPDEVSRITNSQYTDMVRRDKNGYWSDDAAFEYSARREYLMDNADGDWDSLPENIKDKYRGDVLESTPVDEMRIAYADEVARNTIDTIDQQFRDGAFRDGYTPDDVMRMIRSDADPRTYYTDEYYAAWQSKWNPVDGRAEVCIIQTTGGKGCFNSSPYMNGNVGRGEGAFVMPASEYERILSECKMPDGSINRTLLGQKLGGVDVSSGDVVLIRQTVDIDQIEMPKGSLDGSFIGDWIPGGQTSGGLTEGLVPQVHLQRSKFDTTGSSIVQYDGTTRIEISSIAGEYVDKPEQLSGFIIGY